MPNHVTRYFDSEPKLEDLALHFCVQLINLCRRCAFWELAEQFQDTRRICAERGRLNRGHRRLLPPRPIRRPHLQASED